MNKEVRKEILYDLSRTIEILEKKEAKEPEELKTLSDHAIEDVALHKDLDLISITVLIYSLYKIIASVPAETYKDFLTELQSAKNSLGQNNLAKYNQNIKSLFNLISKSNVKVKEHLHDVMHAARIKKGTVLLQKGLSIGQAAGLMGLSNWDLQEYAGKTNVFEQHRELISAKKRLTMSLKIFGVQ